MSELLLEPQVARNHAATSRMGAGGRKSRVARLSPWHRQQPTPNAGKTLRDLRLHGHVKK